MGFAAVAAIIGAGATVYSADKQRQAAHEQADQQRQAAADAAVQATETARGNALAQQAAVDRQNAEATARANADLAAQQQAPAPEVQLTAASNPIEAARRRTVRASFSADEASSNPIRV
jgi:hypothetical protein